VCCTPLRAVRTALINVSGRCGPACAGRPPEGGAGGGSRPSGAAGAALIETTRVVVDGRVIESDGKTENAQHVLALDPFTLAALKAHVEQLDQERREFGPDYQDHGVLFCWEDGRPPHPDTITRRFKKLAAAAGLPEIDLHDVRHSYATAGRDAKIDWKALSQRIGHADVAFTMKQYVQTDLEADRQVANTLAELIIGGSLASFEMPGTA
jgi:integrase